MKSPLDKYRTGASLTSNYAGKKHKVIQIGIAKPSKPTHPNHPEVMQRTLNAVRKNGYKGANFIK